MASPQPGWVRGARGLHVRGPKRQDTVWWWAPAARGGGDLVLRLRFVPDRRNDLRVVLRGSPQPGAGATAGAPPASWVVLRLYRDRLSLGAYGAGGTTRPLASERAPLHRKRAVELAVLVQGDRLLATLFRAKRGSRVASLTATLPASARGRRLALGAGPRQRPRGLVTALSARPACKGPSSARRGGPPVYVTVAAEAARGSGGRVAGTAPSRPAYFTRKAALMETLSPAAQGKAHRGKAQRVAGKVREVYRTDALGLELLTCAAGPPEAVSLETPWKYVDASYRRERQRRRPIHTPTGFVVDASYKNPEMSDRLLRAYARRFPKLARYYVLGRTHEGRPLGALRIGRGDPAGKPAVLLNGAHHGNEPLSIEPVFEAIQELLEHPERPRVRAWLDALDVWCVPVVNPDGLYAFLEVSRRTGRKNGRDLDGDGRRGRLEGVDLNRNYPYRWHTLGERGSHSNPKSPWYRGSKAASEPEVRAMVRLGLARRFAASLSFHVGTVAVLAPYTIDDVLNPVPNEAWEVAEGLVRDLPDHPDERPWEVRRNLYSVDGTDQDWLRHELGTVALLVEGARGAPRRSARRREVVAALRPLWRRLLTRVASRGALRGTVRNARGEPVVARVEVAETKLRAGERWTSRCADGHFDRLMPWPGRYTVRATVDGLPTVERAVDVGSRPVTVELVIPDAPAATGCPALPKPRGRAPGAGDVVRDPPHRPSERAGE